MQATSLPNTGRIGHEGVDCMSLPRYPEYKDSGVDWLGEVPGHWEVAPLKRNFQIVGGSTPKSEQEAFWDGEIVWVTPSDLSKLSSIVISDSQRKITPEGLASCGTTLVPSGSIVLSTRAPIGSLAIAETELCTNQGCKSLVPFADTQSHFYGYLLSISTGELNIRGKGTTFLELSGDELGAFKVSVPPISEQQTIAAFLDRETGKIDALIAEQQRLVELLAEKRQAVISHAVTKGLNPNAPMKGSGIEWLGEVPEHWELKRLKYLGEAITGLTYSPSDIAEDDKSGILVLRSSNVQGGVITFDDNVYVSSAVPKELVTQVGDILICSRNGSRALIGKNATIVESSSGLTFGAFMTVFRSRHSAYLSCVLNSPLFEFQSGAFMTSTINQLTIGVLNNFEVPLPPENERADIAAYLAIESAKFDTLTAEANRAIELLQERRSALISAAVTGKIDVRSYFSSLERA